MLANAYTAGTNRLTGVSDSGDQNAGATPHSYSYDADGAVVGDFQQISSQVGYHEVTLGMTLDRRKLPVGLLAERMTFAGDGSGDYSLAASYRYGASGERYYKNVDGSVEYYLLTGAATGRPQQTGVYTGTSGQTLRHFNLLLPSGEVFGRLMGTTSRHYYVKDHLGTTRAVVDYSGVVVEHHDYDAYGMELQGRGQVGSTLLNERYTGHQFDAETGLLYAGARLLDPEVARWLSVDPLAESYSSWSPYTYTINNPVNSLDPDGRYVIFVNGQHGGKRWQAYWGKFDDPFIERYKGEGVSYVDGAMGGWANTVNTLSRGLFGLFDDSMHNIISESRFNHGYALGKSQADQIRSQLAEGETVKIISHSMGGAFAIGLAIALKEAGLPIDYHLAVAAFKSGKLDIGDVVTYTVMDEDDMVSGRQGIIGSTVLPKRRLLLGTKKFVCSPYSGTCKPLGYDGIDRHSIDDYDGKDLLNKVDGAKQSQYNLNRDTSSCSASNRSC